MLWKYDYHCPHCDHQLSENDKIRFLVKTKSGILSTLVLSAIPGVYDYESSAYLGFHPGDRTDFYCGSCQSNLQSDTYIEFIEVDLKVMEDKLFKVYFSPVYGEQVTYIETEEGLLLYGENFFQKEVS